MRRIVSIVATLVCVSCGSSPTGPSPLKVGGVWSVTTRLTSATGGDCVGPTLSTQIGTTDRYTAAITQTGAILTATVTSQTTGTSAQYSGQASNTTISLNLTSTQLGNVRLTCSNGVIRNISLIGSGLTATVTGNTGSGTQAESYNVTTTAGAAVGILIANSTFTMQR